MVFQFQINLTFNAENSSPSELSLKNKIVAIIIHIIRILMPGKRKFIQSNKFPFYE